MAKINPRCDECRYWEDAWGACYYFPTVVKKQPNETCSKWRPKPPKGVTCKHCQYRREGPIFEPDFCRYQMKTTADGDTCHHIIVEMSEWHTRMKTPQTDEG